MLKNKRRQRICRTWKILKAVNWQHQLWLLPLLSLLLLLCKINLWVLAASLAFWPNMAMDLSGNLCVCDLWEILAKRCQLTCCNSLPVGHDLVRFNAEQYKVSATHWLFALHSTYSCIPLCHWIMRYFTRLRPGQLQLMWNFIAQISLRTGTSNSHTHSSPVVLVKFSILKRKTHSL